MEPFGVHAPQGAYSQARVLLSQWCRIIIPWGSSIDALKQVATVAAANYQKLIVTITSHKSGTRDQQWLRNLVTAVPIVSRIQVENEVFWQWPEGEIESYINHLNRSYATIVAASSNKTSVICGAYTGGVGTSTKERQAKAAMTRIVQIGKFHFVDFHCYADEPQESVLRMSFLRQTMQSANKVVPIVSLESAGPWNSYSVAAHSVDVVQRYVLSIAAGIDTLCWSSLIPTAGWDTEFLRLALVDGRGVRTPAFYTYALLASKLTSATKVSAINAPSGVVIHEVERANANKMHIAWSENGSERQVNLPVPGTTYNVWHTITTPGQVIAKQEQITAVGGKLPLTISKPIFIERAA